MFTNYEKYFKIAWGWISRNTVAIGALLAVMLYLGFSSFIISTLAIGTSVVIASALLSGIVIFVLTKVRFLDEEEYLQTEKPEITAAKIQYNAIVRIVIGIIYFGTATALAVSIFIAQWRQ